jgi:hypothetical protein
MDANTPENTRDKSRTQRTATNRRKRVPLHSRDILTVHNKKPDKVYRWVKDQDDRLYRFRMAEWEFVTDKGTEVGEPTVNASKEAGSVIVKRSGADELYLMCIDKDLYLQDQADKQRDIDDMERAMYEQLNSSQDGRYGSVKTKEVSED